MGSEKKKLFYSFHLCIPSNEDIGLFGKKVYVTSFKKPQNIPGWQL